MDGQSFWIGTKPFFCNCVFIFLIVDCINFRFRRFLSELFWGVTKVRFLYHVDPREKRCEKTSEKLEN